MKKVIVIGLFILGLATASHFENNYTSECKVTARNGASITLTDKNGNDWQYTPEDKYPCVGETVLVKFNTNGTVSDSSDDKIIKVVF